MLEMDVIETETNWLAWREYPGFNWTREIQICRLWGSCQLVALITNEHRLVLALFFCW